MKRQADILKNPIIKKALDNFKPRPINERRPLKVQIGTFLIEKIQAELKVFQKDLTFKKK